MGFIFGILKRLIKLVIYFAVFAAIIVFIPNLPPYTKFTAIKLEATLPQVGPLAINGALNNAEKLYNGKLLGPEAFQLHNGEVYTSLATGEIMKISPGGHLTFVTQIGKPCAGIHQEHICGRPLGFAIDEKKNTLYTADAYHGIWSVDLNTDKKQLLVSPNVEIDGRKPKLFNSVALAKNGDLYWTDSSSDFHLRDGVYSVLADPRGRLLQYNFATKKNTVLLDDLWFANGIAISSDDQFIVVAETGRLRLQKYYINGPKKGHSEVFIAGLPGTPDNLRALPDGSGVLVSLFTTIDVDQLKIYQSFSEAPLARKFITRLIKLIELPFEYLNTLYPHVILEEIVHNIGNFKTTSKFHLGNSGLLQLDWNSNIVASYYNTDGTFPALSDAIVFDNKLYLGAPHNVEYIGAVPVPPGLKKAFSSTTKFSNNNAAKTSSNTDNAKPVKKAEEKLQDKPKVEEKKPVNVEKPVTSGTNQKAQAQQQAKPVPPKQPEVRTQSQAQQQAKPVPPKQPEVKSPTQAKQQDKPVPAKQPEGKNPAQTQQETKSVPPQQPAGNKPNVKVEPTVKASNTQSGNKDKNTAPEPQKPVKVNPSKSPGNKPVPEQIPIREEIPSDTVKPSKETLKVIKKDGPTEIPNPSV
ncbi:adipocyte plasma membrane-associated protein Hemomucin-like [Achroia grisella]|uniref:adipocyte plasma membrane-associated protein Hemomucin-like n=1 Tax=Achroia grisella TaxID=688607 RepID=UPI0027D2433B|nr:adipocyte plasma membrane-associated protein Hemomucin-like [Achroia grisella]